MGSRRYASAQMNLRVPHPWFLRVGSYAVTSQLLFSSALPPCTLSPPNEESVILCEAKDLNHRVLPKTGGARSHQFPFSIFPFLLPHHPKRLLRRHKLYRHTLHKSLQPTRAFLHPRSARLAYVQSRSTPSSSSASPHRPHTPPFPIPAFLPPTTPARHHSPARASPPEIPLPRDSTPPSSLSFPARPPRAPQANPASSPLLPPTSSLSSPASQTRY